MRRLMVIGVSVVFGAAVVVPTAGASSGRVVCQPGQSGPSGQTATIVGTPGNDVLVGTPGPDVIAGLGGNDVIRGLGGNDVLCGWGGKDRIFGGDGNDFIVGMDGDDLIFGGDGDDAIGAGAGADVIHAGAGDDDAYGDGVDDARDVVFGGPGDDFLSAGLGNDLPVRRLGRRHGRRRGRHEGRLPRWPGCRHPDRVRAGHRLPLSRDDQGAPAGVGPGEGRAGDGSVVLDQSSPVTAPPSTPSAIPLTNPAVRSTGRRRPCRSRRFSRPAGDAELDQAVGRMQPRSCQVDGDAVRARS